MRATTTGGPRRGGVIRHLSWAPAIIGRNPEVALLCIHVHFPKSSAVVDRALPSCLRPCRQAVALNSDHFRAYKLMGSALYALGDFEGAKAALKESLK